MSQQMNADADADSATLQALYAKVIYSLRESRKELLRRYGVDQEAQLLDQIRSGEVAEHPSYEHYLSALIVEQTRMQVRMQAAAQMAGSDPSATSPVSVHLMLKDEIEQHYAARLAEPVRMAQDALLLSFDNGLMIEARYFSLEEYSIGWSWGEAEWRMDTAPVHHDLVCFPHHVHDDVNQLRAVDRSAAGADCWRHLAWLIDQLLVDPMLGAIQAATAISQHRPSGLCTK